MLSKVARSLVCSLALFSLNGGLLSAAIPADKDAPTLADRYQRMLAFKRGEIQLYEKHTQDPVELRSKVIAFIKDAQGWLWGENHPIAELQATAKALRASGAADPLFRAYYVMIDYASKDREVIAFADQTYADLCNARHYPISTRLMLLRGLRVYNSQANVLQRHDPPGWHRNFISAVTAWVLDHAQDTQQHARVFEDIFDAYLCLSVKQQRAILDGCKDDPAADAWTVQMLRGMYFHALAWEARGSGFVDRVTPQGALTFSKNIRRAAGAYKKAWNLEPKLPHAAGEMVRVAMTGEVEETTREWFDRTVEARLDYLYAFRYLLFSLRPRWGGSVTQMYELGVECAATKRYDTRVPYFFVQAVTDIEEELGGTDRMWKEPQVYAQAKEVFEGYASRNDEPETVSWARGTLLALALKNDDFALARKQVDQLPADVVKNLDVANGYAPDFTTSRMYAMTGAAARLAKDFEELRQDRDWPAESLRKRAATCLSEARQKNDDKRAETYFAYHQHLLEQDARFLAGDWVMVGFDTPFKWVTNPQRAQMQRALPVAPQSQVQWVAEPLPLLNLPFEAEAEIDVPFRLFSESGDCGILLRDETGSETYFCIAERGGAAGVINPTKTGALVRTALPTKASNKLRIACWQSGFCLYLNDIPVLLGEQEPLKIHGLGMRSSAGDAKFKLLRVRQANSAPPEPESDLLAYRAFHRELARRNLQSPSAIYIVALFEAISGPLDCSIDHFLSAIGRGVEGFGIHLDVGEVYERTGQFAGAKEHFELALKDAPDIFEVNNKLAWLLATCPLSEVRDGKRALTLARRACELKNYKEWYSLSSLAAAHAETGDFTGALKWARQAFELAPRDGQPAMQKEIDLYTAKKPVRGDVPAKPPTKPRVDS